MGHAHRIGLSISGRLAVVCLGFALPALAGRGQVQAAQLFIDPMFGVSVTNNVQYTVAPTVGGDKMLQMDVYRPTGPNLPAALPAIVLMHGGTFVSGDKSNMAAAATEFAKRGYVAVSINYRKLGVLPPPPGELPDISSARIPAWLPGDLASWGVTLEQYVSTVAAATADQAAAVNYLAAHAATYSIDPRMIAAGGYSAGAVSSLLLGAGAVDGASADIKVAVSFAGGMFGMETAIGPGDAAVYAVHGTLDSTIPFTEYSYLQQAMLDAGLPFESLVLPGVGHGLSPSSLLANDAIFEFLIENLRPVPEPGTVALGGIGAALCLSAARRSRKRRDPTYDN